VLYCDVHGNSGSLETNLERLRTSAFSIDDSDLLRDLTMPVLPREFLNDPPANRRNTGRNSNQGRASPGGSSGSRNSPQTAAPEENAESDASGGDGYLPDLGIELPAYNFLLE
jgi:hypothetical protein